MIECPNCEHNEIVGALFCSECGASLIQGGKTQQSIRPSGPANRSYSNASISSVTEPVEADLQAGITLYLVGTGKVLPLGEQGEMILGRASEGQSASPDVDLGLYGGYDEGVSRLHAAILAGKPFMIKDLDSVNGTQINDKMISPHIPHPLSHGDILTLGSMKVQVFIRE